MESPPTDYTPIETALKEILRLTRPSPSSETVELGSAYGRVAAADLRSPAAVPESLRSHMDGYALSSAATRGASSRTPRSMDLRGKARITEPRLPRISKGEAFGVVTGGPLPFGADAVVPSEEATLSKGKVLVTREFHRGEYCFPRGADVRKGSILVRQGTEIRAQDVGLLTLVGIQKVSVFARPKVALLPTGSELIPSASTGSSPVPDTHTPIFIHLLRECGAEPLPMAAVPDDLGRIVSALRKALDASDLVLTLGGTSRGEKDLVARAVSMAAKDATVIHGLRMDRGRVSGVVAAAGKPLVMLPGPIQAATNAFILLALPLLSRLAGRTGPLYLSIDATLEGSWTARKPFSGFTKVLYVSLRRTPRGLFATPVVGDTESMVVLTRSDGFVVIPERTTELSSGTVVQVNLLPGTSSFGQNRSPPN